MSETTYTTDGAVNRIDDERAWWESILNATTPENMEQPGVAGAWSLKDVVAHLSGWQRRTLDRLAAGCQGESAPLPPWPLELEEIEDEDESVDRINAWIYESNRGRSVAEVLAESRGQWDELRALVDTMPESVLNDPDRFPNLEGKSLGDSIASRYLFSHFHDEHEPGFRVWIEGL